MRFQTIDAFIEYTVKRLNTGRFGFEHFKAAMAELGNPQFQLKCIHVAGTNGKGSTTNYLRSILQHAGYTVGTFTSPHLIVHNDRIRINDVYISDEALLVYGNRFVDFIETHNLSMFEIDMLIAVHYFLENQVDLVVFEVGLGGRLDATNVVLPMLSIITTIGFDHMELLGDTLPKIAAEKAGIIKPNVPVLTAEPKASCLNVFRKVCEANHSPLHRVERRTRLRSTTGLRYRYKTFTVHLPTLAHYQIQNSAIAIEAALIVRQHSLDISDEAIVQGIQNTQWKGRFETMSTDPLIIIDGAHNTHGIHALTQSLSELPHPIIVVFSALRDKETDKMLAELIPLCDDVIVTSFNFYRAATALELAHDFPVHALESPADALRMGLSKSKGGTLLVTGSLYFISEVRQTLIPNLLKEHHES
jgi:dihydrofolate synthase / folylpolyglutamate synthase